MHLFVDTASDLSFQLFTVKNLCNSRDFGYGSGFTYDKTALIPFQQANAFEEEAVL